MYDVIVVGAGPAGTAAAKRCAEHGLNTLILEKHKLPRDKVCSGFVFSPVAHALIKQEFGNIPEAVLTEPPRLKGCIFHVPGVGSQELDDFTLVTWRRTLDYWMNQKAEAKGVEIWQDVRVTGVKQKGQGFSVNIEKDKAQQELEARFVVGADGAKSVVRESLFPELKINYQQAYQEGYSGELALDKNYCHRFFTVDNNPPFFIVHQKDNFIIIAVAGELGQAKKYMNQAKVILAENYSFDISQKPAWKDACIEMRLHEELISHTFLPAKGNVLLVGDAGSLVLPISGEGIGTALRTGLLAADSILKAMESDKQADRIYLSQVENFVSIVREVYSWKARIAEERSGGGHSLLQVLRDAYQSTLRMY